MQACKKYPAGPGRGQAGLCPSAASIAASNRRLLGLNLAEKNEGEINWLTGHE